MHGVTSPQPAPHMLSMEAAHTGTSLIERPVSRKGFSIIQFIATGRCYELVTHQIEGVRRERAHGHTAFLFWSTPRRFTVRKMQYRKRTQFGRNIPHVPAMLQLWTRGLNLSTHTSGARSCMRYKINSKLVVRCNGTRRRRGDWGHISLRRE